MNAENLLIINDLFEQLINRIAEAVIKQIDPRLQALEKDSTETANRLYAISTDIETMGDRLEKELGEDNGRITISTIKNLIDAKLEDYDPCDYHGFERAVEGVIDDYGFESKIKEVLNDLDLRITIN